MKSIQWKLVAIYLTLVFLVMLVSGTIIVVRTAQNDYDRVRRELQVVVNRIQKDGIVMEKNNEHKKVSLAEDMKNIPGLSGYQIYVLDHMGNVWDSTVATGDQVKSFRDHIVIQAGIGQAAYDRPRRKWDGVGQIRRMLSYAYPVINEGDQVEYIIYVSTDIERIQTNLRDTIEIILMASLLALIFTCAIGYGFATTLTEPIATLTSKAKQMAQGKLEQQIVVKSNDEIGQLTETFNYMAAELHQTLSTISSEKNKLETVLAHMADGILAFDAEGRLIHANPSAHQILGLGELSGDFHSLFQKLDIELEFSRFFTEDAIIIKQHILVIGKKYINAHFALYQNEHKKTEGMIVVLQDVTEQKKLEDMRKEFVANVSHELRTPLTTVKSYAETLLEGALNEPDLALQFLQVINHEADRMTVLVQDLLQLSRLDNQQIQFHMQSVHLHRFLEDIVSKHRIHADKKSQTVSYVPPSSLVKVMIDPDRITQVMSNVLSNAVKYSLEAAHIEVRVELPPVGELPLVGELPQVGEQPLNERYIKVVVEDTGMGIPEEDLPRIFERFYRVDKARSRAMGGTGLGLAIAREIMELHGGSITVKSIYGKGTVITLWFPVFTGEQKQDEILDISIEAVV